MHVWFVVQNDWATQKKLDLVLILKRILTTCVIPCGTLFLVHGYIEYMFVLDPHRPCKYLKNVVYTMFLATVKCGVKLMETNRKLFSRYFV